MNKGALLTIGKVTGVHGLNGMLKVWSFAESINTFSCSTSVLLKSENEQGRSYEILKASNHKKGLLLTLKGIDSRYLAENLVGYKILIDQDQLPELEEDSWYWQDLLGLDVFDHEKGFIGRITNIFPTGADDVLVIADNDQETLVPMHKHFVESVDIAKKTVRIRLPEDY